MMRLAFRGLPHECWARRVAVRAAARHLSLASYHTFRGFQAPPRRELQGPKHAAILLELAEPAPGHAPRS